MKVIDTDRGNNIYSVTFHADRKHLVGGGMEGIIRGWRVADGEEVDELMGADDWVFNIAVSRDGKWIASGTRSGQVQVWNAEDGDKLIEFNAHNHWVYAVDVSPDSTKIATGSDGRTVCIWLLSTGERLLGPWKHKASVVGVKFSPDGRFIATATWSSCVRVYDAQDGVLLVDVPIHSTSPLLGPATASSSLSYPQTTTVTASTPPLGQLSLNGPSTAIRHGAAA